MTLCPVRSEPWDDSATMNCQKPSGHDGPHRYCTEWGDDGRFIRNVYECEHGYLHGDCWVHGCNHASHHA